VSRRAYRFAVMLALIGFALGASNARAADKLVVAKAISTAWTFVAMDVGQEIGMWSKYGIEPEVISMGGGAKLAQALTSGSIDIGLSGGPVLGFMAKGVPAKGVAVSANEPHSMSVIVPYNSPIKTVDDLKGKRMGVTTVGSLTSWMTQHISMSKGWGPNGITLVVIGGDGTSSDIAALKMGQIESLMIAPEQGFMLEKQHEARILLNASDYVQHFMTHIIFARDQMIAERPDVLERFLKGWFATIAYMRTHKDETDRIAAKALKQDIDVMSRAYDLEMQEMSVDGRFDPEALKVVKESLVDMEILPKVPADDQIFTTRFVPVKP
jgi:ABC-type nitrate/sulfonate/bicarbonate transport system substrate-binding protein